MATEERPEPLEDITGLVSTEPQDLAPVDVPEPTAPKGVTEEEVREMHGRASDLVKQRPAAAKSWN